MRHGGNVDLVLHDFPAQVHACRQRHKRAKTLLIVVVDADEFAVDERRLQLNAHLKLAGLAELTADDPVALLIPRRHVETWIRSLLGDTVSEDDDCKGRKKLTREEVLQAADTAYQWARPKAVINPACVPSLEIALPEWRKIG
jgi:hypothetical protein